MSIETMFQAYVTAALWSSTAEDGTPLDRDYSADDLAPSARLSMRNDCVTFMNRICAAGLEVALDDEQIGHDFWLTRNGHGAGFWDRGIGEVGEKLTGICKTFGESNIYIGDDGRLYVDR